MTKTVDTEARALLEQSAGREHAYVIHPLDDLPEEKRSPDGLGTMRLSGVQQAVLLALRSYILVMLVLVAIKMTTLAGWTHLFGG